MSEVCYRKNDVSCNQKRPYSELESHISGQLSKTDDTVQQSNKKFKTVEELGQNAAPISDDVLLQDIGLLFPDKLMSLATDEINFLTESQNLVPMNNTELQSTVTENKVLSDVESDCPGFIDLFEFIPKCLLPFLDEILSTSATEFANVTLNVTDNAENAKRNIDSNSIDSEELENESNTRADVWYHDDEEALYDYDESNNLEFSIDESDDENFEGQLEAIEPFVLDLINEQVMEDVRTRLIPGEQEPTSRCV